MSQGNVVFRGPQQQSGRLRLIVDPPAGGDWNMAVDEALLNRAAAHSVHTLRFYRWREPTLSLGYFQRYAGRQLHPASRAAPAVRRLSGGGAILHDAELTYSLCLAACHRLLKNPQDVYALVHDVLLEQLRSLSLDASRFEPAQTPAAEAEPFLCFARRSCTDLLLGGHKIVGSAQRRRRGALLQHGSLLLAGSRAAPELPGIREIVGRTVEIDPLITQLSVRLAERLALEVEAGTLGFAELREAKALMASKYGQAVWTQKR